MTPEHAMKLLSDWAADQREREAWRNCDQSTYRLRAEMAETVLAEIERLRAVVIELKKQRGRLKRIEEDYSQGLPERRLADDLSDALSDALETYEAAEERDASTPEGGEKD